MDGAITLQDLSRCLPETTVARNVLIVDRTSGSRSWYFVIVTPCLFCSGELFAGSCGWKPLSGPTAVVSLPLTRLVRSTATPANSTIALPHKRKRLKRADDRAVWKTLIGFDKIRRESSAIVSKPNPRPGSPGETASPDVYKVGRFSLSHAAFRCYKVCYARAGG